MITKTVLFVGMLTIAGSANAALYDRGGGLIYDSTLNVTWLQDASYGAGSSYDDGIPNDGRMSWGNAVPWAANLNYFDSVRSVTYSDWRLPTVSPINGTSFNYNYSFDGSTDFGWNITSPNSELAYMFYINLGNQGRYLPDGTESGCNTIACLTNTAPFTNLQPGSYWTNKAYELYTSSAWYFYMNGGGQTVYPDTGDGGFYA